MAASTEGPGIVDGDRLDAERQVLQVLCQGTPHGSVLDLARTSLRAYRWRDPVHEVIFDIILSLPAGSTPMFRDLLPARLTRRGFPDFAIDDLFQPNGLSKPEAERLIESLHRMS